MLKGTLRTCVCVSAMAFSHAAALAQQSTSATAPDEAVTAAERQGLADIVVTAQRREQNLRDVPISAVVFDNAAIERRGASALGDVLAQAANVNLTNGGNRSNLDITIRGVSALVGGGESGQQTFGIYIDGLNISSVPTIFSFALGSGINQRLLDIERIEVLRGPQGTYFGRNAIGGGISIITKKPNDVLSADAHVDYSSFDTLEMKATVNVPILKDLLSFRGTVLSYTTDGAVRNILDPIDPRSFIPATSNSAFLNAIDRNVNIDGRSSSERTLGLRGAVRLTPSSNLTIDANLTYQLSKFGIPQQTTLALGSTADGSPDPGTIDLYGGFINDDIGYFPRNRSRAAITTDYGARNEAITAVVAAEWKLPDVTISANAAYNSVKINADFQNYSRALTNVTVADDTVKNKSLELRISSSSLSNFQWFVGAFAAKDTQYFNEVIYCLEPTCTGVGVFPAANIDPAFLFTATLPNNRVTNYAAFGEVSYQLWDRLTLAFAGRQSWEKTIRFGAINGVDGEELLVIQNDTTKLSEFTPRFSASYKIDSQVNLYATASKGFRSGSVSSFETGFPLEDLIYGPEFIWNYEAGLKGVFFDRKVSANLALFQMDYTDIQVPQPVRVTLPGSTVPTTEELVRNAGAARIRGIEVELAYRPADDLTLQASGGYLNAKFTKDVLDPDGNIDVMLKGETLPRSRKFNAAIALDYTRDVGSGIKATAHLEARALSKGFETIERTPSSRLPAYQVVNVRLGVERGPFTLVGYVNNLLNEKYYTSTTTEFPIGTLVDINPRIFGVRASAKF